MKFCYILILTRSSSRNCKMTFIIGRGFAERQILKKWKWPYLLNWVEYFDKLLRKHWYWQDLAQEIVKWHVLLVEALPSSKFWKSENGPISWTEWNIVMKFCIHIDIDKMYPMRLSNDICDWLSRGLNSEKKEAIAKWQLSSVEVCRASNSENVKMALSLELSGIFWWNFAYTLVYWQDVAREIVKWHLGWSRFCRGSNSEKKVKINYQTVWNILIKFCRQFDVENIYLAQGIAKWHLSSVEALPSSKF